LGGGDDEGWKFREFEDYEINLSWYDEDDDDELDFAEQAIGHLKEVTGYANPEREMLFKFVPHGYDEWILSAHQITAKQGEAVSIYSLVDLATSPSAKHWDGRLARVLELLGITPTQETAEWILAADYV
jgi:hypothetical protein